ncbi:RHS repeat-associated core domain-containing protein [Clostridium sp. UBA4395]|uniref:RHS repeat-associated core domain-containing protein n=1 Tax=Clostridium sp. UBA4395 TaxID=1946360 RepID=UPI0032165DC5
MLKNYIEGKRVFHEEKINVQSRYYNPEWGRFLNVDAIGGNVGALLSHNIFAYCNNNPVNGKDPNGFRPMYTQGEETAAMRDASYKVMNNYGKRKNKSTSGVITTRTTRGYTRHVADAEIANVTGIYGKSGVFGSCEISTPDFPIQAFLGGATGIGAVWNGDNKWNVYEAGLHLTPLKAGERLKGGIGIFNCELQVGASLGIGGSFTT